MKVLKTLLVSSLLAAAGTTHATTIATFNGTTTTSIIITELVDNPWEVEYISSEIVYPGSGIGTASAVLDDSGTLAITAHVHVQTSMGTDNDLDILDSLTGIWDGTTFTATGGTRQYTGCVDNPWVNNPACSSRAFPDGLQSVLTSGSITLAGGLISAAITDSTIGFIPFTITYAYTFGAVTPAVPIPATAWLFGSGLIGLASITRRCRSV